MENRPSAMVRKLLQAKGRVLESDPNTPAYDAFRKEPYFFYGTLMDSSTLARILKLRDPPALVPAKIVGYSCKLWGHYPALLDGPPGATVHGKTYVVQTLSDRKRLEAYETDHYTIVPCLIELQGGREVEGSTFLWNEDEADLKEGTFDLKDWQMDRVESRSRKRSPPMEQTKQRPSTAQTKQRPPTAQTKQRPPTEQTKQRPPIANQSS